MYKNNM